MARSPHPARVVLRRMTALALLVTALAATAALAGPAGAPAAAPSPGPEVQEHVLANGMKVLFVPRHITPSVAAGWVAKVGSANEHTGITGLSHLFEHMMFKGTSTIGTKDAALDRRLMDEQERVQAGMRAELSLLRAAQRRGDIADMMKPEARTPRYVALEARFDSLVAAQRDNMVKNEFDNILQRNGGSRINAFTNNDMTFYFENLPANKLELWFWLEADRIGDSVFREFYSERDVVNEERRLSVESTPTGKYQEAFDAVFWEASPYNWPVIGWPSDVAALTYDEARAYYALYYAPQNLCAVLVGDFDPQQALALAEKYLGSIPAGPRPAPEMITMEPRQLAEKRFYGEAETNPAVTVRWHTVAAVHRDVPALEVLSGILDGPAGRLRRALVLGDGPATSVRAGQDALKYEGMFEIEAEAKEGRTPEQVEAAVYTELEKLQREAVPADELQGVKNRYLAASYRQLDSNYFLMLRYGRAEATGSWRDADADDRAVQLVTADDVQRVAKTYFTRENRAVAVWTRKADAGAEDPALAAVPAEAKPMVMGSLARLQAMTDAAQVQAYLGRLEERAGQMPPGMKGAMDYLRTKAQARLAELQAGNK
ncbi:MAG: M16 family metallopeptidase [Candidatus Krumholzibacteriia bacterium]